MGYLFVLGVLFTASEIGDAPCLLGTMVKRRTLRDEQRPVGTDEEADDRQSAVLIAGRGAGEVKLENLLRARY